MAKVIIVVLIGAIAVLIVFQCIDPRVETIGGVANASNTLVLDTDSISVTISGEVVRQGTYILEINSTLESLIGVAGGVTSNADELAYDTSYLLEDSMAFYIAPKYNNTDVCSLEPITKVNINADTEEGLQIVSGIGATIAKAIISP